MTARIADELARLGENVAKAWQQAPEQIAIEAQLP